MSLYFRLSNMSCQGEYTGGPRILPERLYFLVIVSTMLVLLVLFSLAELFPQLVSGDILYNFLAPPSIVYVMEA